MENNLAAWIQVAEIDTTVYRVRENFHPDFDSNSNSLYSERYTFKLEVDTSTLIGFYIQVVALFRSSAALQRDKFLHQENIMVEICHDPRIVHPSG